MFPISLLLFFSPFPLSQLPLPKSWVGYVIPDVAWLPQDSGPSILPQLVCHFPFSALKLPRVPQGSFGVTVTPKFPHMVSELTGKIFWDLLVMELRKLFSVERLGWKKTYLLRWKGRELWGLLFGKSKRWVTQSLLCGRSFFWHPLIK